MRLDREIHYLQQFAIYINDLANEMKQLNMGVASDNDTICILLYADDIVILTEDQAQLQLVFNFTNNNWKMKINRDKTKIVHYRKKHLGQVS